MDIEEEIKMTKRPTQEQIDQEIATLKTMMPSVMERNGFGDNHHDAIDGQVLVLERRLSTDSVWDSFGDEGAEDFAQNVLDEALRAAEWLRGELAETPSVSWQDLVVK